MRPVAIASLTLLALGCERHAHPWDQPDASSTMAVAPPPPIAPHEPQVDAGDAGEAADAAPPPAVDSPTPPVRVGGPWVRCYGSFRPSGDPIKDVTRLSIACGPENGMKRLSKQPLQGAVREGGPGVSESFQARRGECYRLFAVADAQVSDLDVVLRSSRGAAIAADHGEDGWPIVQPDRPICPLEDDRLTFEVTAKRGSGRFAAEVWVLRTPGAKK